MANPLDDLPQGLADLIRRFGDLVDGATERLQELGISFANVTQWQEAMEELIMRYHIAGFMRGADSEQVSKEARDKILEFVNIQFGYLDNFALEMVDSEEWVNGWNSRAKSYATSVKAPYWTGKINVLPVPAVPGDLSSQCGQSCYCRLDVRTINEKRGDYDIYWIYGENENHCQTCKERERTWNPLKVREGVLLL